MAELVAIVAAVAAAVAAVAAGQVLARTLHGYAIEPRWRPLRSGRRDRSPSPPELAQLEQLVADALAGDPAAAARVAARLHACGATVGASPTPARLLAALEQLPVHPPAG
jgi:hypothetical protein